MNSKNTNNHTLGFKITYNPKRKGYEIFIPKMDRYEFETMVNADLDKDYKLEGTTKQNGNITIATTQGYLPFTAKDFHHIRLKLQVEALRKPIEAEQKRRKEMEDQRKLAQEVKTEIDIKKKSTIQQQKPDIPTITLLVKDNPELFSTLPKDIQNSVLNHLAGITENKTKRPTSNDAAYRKMMIEDERFRTNYNQNYDGRIVGAYYSGQGDMGKR